MVILLSTWEALQVRIWSCLELWALDRSYFSFIGLFKICNEIRLWPKSVKRYAFMQCSVGGALFSSGRTRQSMVLLRHPVIVLLKIPPWQTDTLEKLLEILHTARLSSARSVLLYLSSLHGVPINTL
jgi:hypothetical protein